MPHNTPIISVIIPSYNHAPYIEEAISSVLNQSFKDFELIIIDDASQDQSWQLIQGFNDKRIRYIQHADNQGAAQTINEGLALAKGECLTILNSDDSYHPERLKTLYAVKKDFVVSDLQLWDEHSQSKEKQESNWVSWFENLKNNYRESNDFLATLLQGNFLITTSNFFFSRAVYEHIKGFSDLRYVHDYEFALNVLFADFQVEYCEEKLLNYRLHNTNTIREAPLSAIQENTKLLLSLAKNYKDKFSHQPQYIENISQHLKELYQYTNEEWQSKLHHKLVDKESELFPLIKDRDAWISDRDEIIKQQLIDIANLKRQGRVNKEKLSEDNSKLQQKKELIEKQAQWVADRDVWIIERDAIIKQQQLWIQERDAWVAERDQTIQIMENKVKVIQASRHYRLGKKLLAPLSLLKRIIKGDQYA